MKHDADQIKHAAQGQWQYILPRIGIPESSLKNKHQPCPMCGGKDRFRFDDKQGLGTYICNQCGAGDGFSFIMAWQQCSYPDALATVARILGITNGEISPTHRQPETPSQTQATKDRLSRLTRIWNDAQPLNDFAKGYYQQRGINPETLPKTDAIRFMPQMDYWIKDTSNHYQLYGVFPCIVAVITDTQGQLQGLHLTYLQTDGKAKLKGKHPQTGEPIAAKKMQSRFSGSLKGAAVQIEQPNADGAIIVAEGIETALAARELFDLPVQATLSANGMKNWQPPENTKTVLIVADNDIPRPVGYEAAHDLAIKLIKHGFRVQIWQPERQGTDALDELNYRHSRAFSVLASNGLEK